MPPLMPPLMRLLARLHLNLFPLTRTQAGSGRPVLLPVARSPRDGYPKNRRHTLPPTRRRAGTLGCPGANAQARPVTHGQTVVSDGFYLFLLRRAHCCSTVYSLGLAAWALSRRTYAGAMNATSNISPPHVWRLGEKPVNVVEQSCANTNCLILARPSFSRLDSVINQSTRISR